jgi:hypothetical protein
MILQRSLAAFKRSCRTEKTAEMAEWLDARSQQYALLHVTLYMPVFDSKNILVLPQPAYSSDLSPCEFWLFPIFK